MYIDEKQGQIYPLWAPGSKIGWWAPITPLFCFVCFVFCSSCCFLLQLVDVKFGSDQVIPHHDF